MAFISGENGCEPTTRVEIFWSDTNAHSVERQLSSLNLDALFCLTPFLTDEEMAARVRMRRAFPVPRQSYLSTT